MMFMFDASISVTVLALKFATHTFVPSYAMPSGPELDGSDTVAEREIPAQRRDQLIGCLQADRRSGRALRTVETRVAAGSPADPARRSCRCGPLGPGGPGIARIGRHLRAAMHRAGPALPVCPFAPGAPSTPGVPSSPRCDEQRPHRGLGGRDARVLLQGEVRRAVVTDEVVGRVVDRRLPLPAPWHVALPGQHRLVEMATRPVLVVDEAQLALRRTARRVARRDGGSESGGTGRRPRQRSRRRQSRPRDRSPESLATPAASTPRPPATLEIVPPGEE